MFLVDRLDGIFNMGSESGSPISEVAMCVAAFAVVASVIMFAHPASQSSRAVKAAAGNAAAAAVGPSKPAGATLRGSAPANESQMAAMPISRPNVESHEVQP
jgi:hypothetical protein